MGKPRREAWPEAWQEVKPQFDEVKVTVSFKNASRAKQMLSLPSSMNLPLAIVPFTVKLPAADDS